MKKFYVLAMVLMVGASCAYAASLNVPWFIDNAGANCGLPPWNAAADGSISLIYLHNNTNDSIVCEIQYYSQDGDALAFEAGESNTFAIAANASLSFRPATADWREDLGGDQPFGQESATGVLVPDRPATVDGQKNGSIKITWAGESHLVQGLVLQTGKAGTEYFQYGSLLPTGF